MASRDPPDHTRLRKLVSQAFTPAGSGRIRPWATSALAAPRTGSFDLVRGLSPLSFTVIADLLGILRGTVIASRGCPGQPPGHRSTESSTSH
jgi:cytochrome P450